MMTNQSTFDIYEEGIRLLTKHLGVLKTETFISTVIREQFDYTKWHQDFSDRMTKEKFHELAYQSETEHPFKGAKATII